MTGSNLGDGLDELPFTALLRSDLDDAIGLSADLADLAPFGDRQRYRLLAIDILARQRGLDRNLRVPVVGGRVMDNVDLFVVDYRPVVRSGSPTPSGG
jgi:hypothetical protein